MFRIAPFFLGLLAFLPALAAAPARAGGTAGGTQYEWSFYQYLSDGAGGATGPQLVETGTQTDGALAEDVVLGGAGSPHAEVFSSEGAADFWAWARSPLTGGGDGDPVGARAELTVSQLFRKELAGATLSVTVPQSELSASHFFGPDNDGLSAILVHELEVGGSLAFSEQASLSGVGGAWTFQNGSTLLPFELAQGGLDQPAVAFRFSEPFVQEVDLSALAAGAEFTVTYRIVAEAIDTVQGKSGIRAFALDPLDESDGVSFAFTGLTPIPAPEPGAALLLFAGAAVLSALARRKA